MSRSGRCNAGVSAGGSAGEPEGVIKTSPSFRHGILHGLYYNDGNVIRLIREADEATHVPQDLVRELLCV